MDINLQALGIKVPQSLPGARSADTPVVKDAVAAPRVPEQNIDIPTVEDQRFERLQRVAQQFFDEVYAVADTTFSIFKDSTGQYVTRFTSLRDGRVTYIPEPKILDYVSRKLQARQALVEVEA